MSEYNYSMLASALASYLSTSNSSCSRPAFCGRSSIQQSQQVQQVQQSALQQVLSWYNGGTKTDVTSLNRVGSKEYDLDVTSLSNVGNRRSFDLTSLSNVGNRRSFDLTSLDSHDISIIGSFNNYFYGCDPRSNLFYCSPLKQREVRHTDTRPQQQAPQPQIIYRDRYINRYINTNDNTNHNTPTATASNTDTNSNISTFNPVNTFSPSFNPSLTVTQSQQFPQLAQQQPQYLSQVQQRPITVTGSASCTTGSTDCTTRATSTPFKIKCGVLLWDVIKFFYPSLSDTEIMQYIKDIADMNNIADPDKIHDGITIQLPLDANYVNKSQSEINNFYEESKNDHCNPHGTGVYHNISNHNVTTERSCITTPGTCSR